MKLAQNSTWDEVEKFFDEYPTRVKFSRKREGRLFSNYSFLKMGGKIVQLSNSVFYSKPRKPPYHVRIKSALDREGNQYVVKIQYTDLEDAENRKNLGYWMNLVRQENQNTYDLSVCESASSRLVEGGGAESSDDLHGTFSSPTKKKHRYLKSYMRQKKLTQTLLDRKYQIENEINEGRSSESEWQNLYLGVLQKKMLYAIELAIELHKLHTGQLSKKQQCYGHADLKPNNVMFDSDDRLHLIDFEKSRSFKPNHIDGQQWNYICCTEPYESIERYDRSHPVRRDLFALFRTLYITEDHRYQTIRGQQGDTKGLNKFSLFSQIDLQNINLLTNNEVDCVTLLNTASGCLSPSQYTTALDVAATLTSVYERAFQSSLSQPQSQNLKRFNQNQQEVARQLLKKACQKSLSSSDKVKTLVAQNIIDTLNSNSNLSENDIKQQLLTAIRVFSHHASIFSGRWMNKFNFTPRTYQSAECLLAKTAQVLSCEQEAKACLLNSYKHHSKGNLIQDHYRYDFFAKSLGVRERSTHSQPIPVVSAV